jgi:bile acid:Na+ symporter, BASS family
MEQSPLISFGLPIALFIIMIGIGLTLTAADFHREARQPLGVMVGTLAQVLLMPALGFGVAAVLRLEPVIAVGLVIVAACPGGSTSNLIAYLARANVALSIVLTVLASVAAILTLPLYVNLALGWWPIGTEAAVRMPVAQTVALLIGIILVPVAIGMAVRRRAPARAASLEKAVSIFGGVVLLLLIVAIIYSVRDRFWELMGAAGPAAILLNLAGVAAGFLSAALVGLSGPDRFTMGIELGVKNTTIGMLVAVTIIGSEAMAVPAAVYGLLMYASGFALVTFGQRAFPRLEVRRAHVPGNAAAPEVGRG